MESTNEISELLSKVQLQGDLVRSLKASDASKDEIAEQVRVLMALKAQMPAKEGDEASKTKKEKKPDARAAKKEARRLARMQAQENSNPIPKVTLDALESSSFGDYELMTSKSSDKTGRSFEKLEALPKAADSSSSTKLWIRGHVHTTRVQAKLLFVLLRQRSRTIQIVISDKDVVKFGKKIPNESVIDVQGTLASVETPTSATECTIELQASALYVVSRAQKSLAFQVIDASRSETEIARLNSGKDEDSKFVSVGLDTRLDSRHLDLRTPLSQSIVRVTSTICHAFRSFLTERDFVEIQTPKLLGGASEGGAEVFCTDYFGKQAILAQSPQLHKQISAACSGLERVFEIGPVFRAENSNTNRHLCEFQGLDLEMCFSDHYHEVLDVFSDLFHSVFDALNQKRHLLDVIKAYYPFEDLVYAAPASVPDSKVVGTTSRTLRLEFDEAVALLAAADIEQGLEDDLSTANEKKLGQLVKDKYGVDFYFLDKFPLQPRPFYTMPCPSNPVLSNSYDFFIRGQEIMSGAQRVHDAELLVQRIKAKGIDPETLRFYIKAFEDGAMPHGGGGVGLERVTMLFLGLPNIRMVRMFPRDPARLMP